ncbi:MAG: hypothetical protein Q8Q42_03370 [Nanoarchaeota archaeon]|nr:hypothetical protein [Nanoarchaeota archaeon]
MPYINETIPSFAIYKILEQNWEENSGETPKPRLFEIGQPGMPLRIDMDTFLNQGKREVIVIRPIAPTMDEVPIGNWTYVNRKTRLNLEIYSRESKQRLYNIFAEVRRIIHLKMHSTVGYQRIQFLTWNETSEESLNFWVGEVVCELVNNAVALET